MLVQNRYRDIWKIALPIILGSLVQSIFNITNTAFLGRVSEITLGAGGIAGVFYFIFVFMLMGLAIGPQIIISRRTGEAKSVEIGRVFVQTLYLMLVFATALFLIIRFTSPVLLKSLLRSGAVYSEAIRYLSIAAFTIFFSSINISFRALYVGLSKTKILTYTSVTMVVVNIFLDYSFIFGNFGFPCLGITGAAISSLVAEITGSVFFIMYTYRSEKIRQMGVFLFRRWSGSITKEILHLSYPSVFQNVASIFSWFLFFVFIEQTGELPLAVSNIIRSVMLLFMMPLWGMATAANTMVSNLLGQQKKEEILRLVKKITILGLLCILVFSPVIIINPAWYLYIYTSDVVLIGAGKGSLIVVYLTMFLFVPSVIIFNALMGTGDTRATFLIEVSAIATYLIYTWLAAVRFNLPLEAVWLAESLYWLQIGVIAWLRLGSLKWDKIKV